MAGRERQRLSDLSDKDGEAGNGPGNPGDTSNLGPWEVSLIPATVRWRGLPSTCPRRAHSGLGVKKSLLVTLIGRVAEVIGQGRPEERVQ